MPIRTPQLKLRLYMPTQIRLRLHQPVLQMLNAHDPLRRIEAREATADKHVLILEVRDGNGNGLVGGGLEAEFAVPGHVLDGEHGTVAEDVHVEFAVGAGWEGGLEGEVELGEMGEKRAGAKGRVTYTKTRFVASMIRGKTFWMGSRLVSPSFSGPPSPTNADPVHKDQSVSLGT